jgi:hypothetical protein
VSQQGRYVGDYAGLYFGGALGGNLEGACSISFSAQGDLRGGGAGGYDDDKPKPKRRFVVERNGKLVVYASQAAALRALQAEEAQQPAQEAAQEVALPIVQAYAEVAGRLDEYNAAYNSRHFEQLLALFDQMRAQLDEEDVEMLLLSL